ncbi:MAG: NYN domain-containing protein [Rhodobacterales bacterium]|nr:NYN domain-containing protein [Rhodobacterales bacterium]
MDCVILVDNSNVFIEGQKLSALQKGIVGAPGQRQPADPSWRINFAGLLAALADGRDIRKAFLVGSRPPPKDEVWKMAQHNGFEVITHDRDANNKEKAVDTELVTQGTLLVATTSPAVLVLASGDRDFIPLIRVAQGRGWSTEMAAFSSAFSNYGEMATTVDKVRPLDTVFNTIGSHSFEWPTPTVESD